MPGIALLEWPAQDLRTAAIDYIQSRQTFASVGDKPADLTLTIKAWLTMRSRNNYHYSLRLESALGPSEKPPIKSYLVEKETVGSSVRWITASDQTPIAEAVKPHWTIYSRRSKLITSCIEMDRAEKRWQRPGGCGIIISAQQNFHGLGVWDSPVCLVIWSIWLV